MKTTQPQLEALPDEFPVFPLTGAMLLPGGKLPLNIFEPRFLAMTEDALAGGRMMAMIQPDPQSPATPNGPALYRVGCLARVTSFSETDDGRYLISLIGLIRFDVAAEVEMRRGYRRVRGDFSRFASDFDEHPDTGGFDRDGVLQALRGYFQHRGFEPNWEAINHMDDVMLITSLSMVCPFDPLEKQALLEAAGFAERAAILRTLLSIDSHETPHDPNAPPPRRMAS